MKHYHIISRIAIYLLSIVMIIIGVYHFISPRDLFLFIPTWVPGGIIWAYIVGGAFVLVGIAFITNNFVKVAGYLLTVVLLIYILFIDLPNYMNAGDKEMQTMALISILKDTAILCFALYITAGAYHQHLHLDNAD